MHHASACLRCNTNDQLLVNQCTVHYTYCTYRIFRSERENVEHVFLHTPVQVRKLEKCSRFEMRQNTVKISLKGKTLQKCYWLKNQTCDAMLEKGSTHLENYKFRAIFWF